MPRLIMLIATGFYTGYLPKAPGTWGTLLAFPVHLLISPLPSAIYTTTLFIIFCVAVFTAGAAEKILDSKDPGIIVIDEIIGMLIALICVPASPAAWLAVFILFRFFDIVKPFPVNWLDKRLNGGLAIVMDDVAAGGYTLLCLHLYFYLKGS
ncbi:MAG: phosphatidylglycerophosphatase A [Desulfurivibrionaceae bacterium]